VTIIPSAPKYMLQSTNVNQYTHVNTQL